MKILLTPSLAYLIGLWKARRTTEGIGIEGNQHIRDVFIREALSLKLTSADKLQLKDEKVFFYHSAYRAFFDDVVKNQLERFQYRNDYAAGYVAGMLDGVGGIRKVDGKTVVFLAKFSRNDDMLLLGIGFRAKKEAGKLAVINGDELLDFTKGRLKFLGVHQLSHGLVAQQ